MDGVLQDCEHEDDDAEIGRKAPMPLSDVYLEAVEELWEKTQQPDETGTSEKRAREAVYSGKAYWRG